MAPAVRKLIEEQMQHPAPVVLPGPLPAR